jgi:hypothetical protein
MCLDKCLPMLYFTPCGKCHQGNDWRIDTVAKSAEMTSTEAAIARHINNTTHKKKATSAFMFHYSTVYAARDIRQKC